MSTPCEPASSEELAALHAQVRHYESELTERDAVIAKHEAMIEHLQEQVRLLLARRFGKRWSGRPPSHGVTMRQGEIARGVRSGDKGSVHEQR